MYDDIEFYRANLSVDTQHDNRHELPDSPYGRESIPYVVHLPDHEIAAFTYTWANKTGEAGAALAIFGPGVGDNPIEQALPDRPVPSDMDFANWVIESFSMRQSLDFKRAEIKWVTDAATVEFSFDAIHPPYAYSSHADGCPAYTAVDRIEQGGKVKGQFTLGDRSIPFDTLGHRDHSWGTRIWEAFQHYNWFQGQSADGSTVVHYWRFLALGRMNLRGYVLKDNVMAEVTNVTTDVDYSDDLWQQRLVSTVHDEAGRVTEVTADFYAHYTLKPSDAVHLRESAARATYDGAPGLGWMEAAWSPDYVDFISKNGPF